MRFLLHDARQPSGSSEEEDSCVWRACLAAFPAGLAAWPTNSRPLSCSPCAADGVGDADVVEVVIVAVVVAVVAVAAWV